jgi:hypothetical protein
MQRYAEYSPTGFDSKGIVLDDQQDWLVVIGRNRDSTLLETSNWEVAEKEFQTKHGDEGNGWEIHRFGHWACGWLEILIVDPDHKAHETATEMQRSLENYPVLCEHNYSEKEHEATLENIAQALRSVDSDDVTVHTPGILFSWFWDNDQSAVENTDDQGGWPTEEQLTAALTDLDYKINS